MTVTGASSGPLTSTCSGTPSEASTTNSRPRSSPNGSARARGGDTPQPGGAARAGPPGREPPAEPARRGARGDPGDLGDPPPSGHASSRLRPVRRPARTGYSTVAFGPLATNRGNDLIRDGAERLAPFLRG